MPTGLKRYYGAGHAHFITCGCCHRIAWLDTAARRDLFLTILEEVRQRCRFEVMRLLVTRELDSKTGALLLYAMQTAAANMKRTSFEPEPTLVVIDRECVERRPLGATAWSKVEGREYDEVENHRAEKEDGEKDELEKKDGEGDAPLRRMIEGVARDPRFLDERPGSLGEGPVKRLN